MKQFSLLLLLLSQSLNRHISGVLCSSWVDCPPWERSQGVKGCLTCLLLLCEPISPAGTEVEVLVVVLFGGKGSEDWSGRQNPTLSRSTWLFSWWMKLVGEELGSGGLGGWGGRNLAAFTLQCLFFTQTHGSKGPMRRRSGSAHFHGFSNTDEKRRKSERDQTG